MTSLKELEKETRAGDAETITTTTAHDTSSAGDRDEDGSPRLSPLKETASGVDSHGRGHSRGSEDSDPLSPLEHALTADIETEAERAAREPLSLVRTTTSIGSGVSRPPDFEVSFEPDDPANPKNWSLAYRAWVIFCVSFSTWVVVLYSTSYTASISGLMEYFDEGSETVVTLGVTTYLLGLAAGSLVVAPLSELYGRQPVYMVCLVIFTILILPCALATSLAEIIVVRFFGYVLAGPLCFVCLSVVDVCLRGKKKGEKKKKRPMLTFGGFLGLFSAPPWSQTVLEALLILLIPNILLCACPCGLLRLLMARYVFSFSFSLFSFFFFLFLCFSHPFPLFCFH
jgi:hypothetical protein